MIRPYCQFLIPYALTTCTVYEQGNAGRRHIGRSVATFCRFARGFVATGQDLTKIANAAMNLRNNTAVVNESVCESQELVLVP